TDEMLLYDKYYERIVERNAKMNAQIE
ncbi:lipoate--protein ligase family protein, partial [Staphylococcus felis]